ncbi:MAG: hypothetical protein K0R78_2304 [Pelosinus sp.]|jgi:hypothetical protein|nr:hypothetical protein [Pelosinus sp.]
MAIQLCLDVFGRINQDRFKDLLRTHHLPVSGTKLELKNRVLSAIENNCGTPGLSIEKFDKFIANEIAHGKNRTLFVSAFSHTVANQIKNLQYVKSCLLENKLPTENFNSLREQIDLDKDFVLLYLNIANNDQVVDKIEMCFAKGTTVELSNDDGENIVPQRQVEYVWVDVLPCEEKMIIKLWNRQGSYFEMMANAKLLYDEISSLVREIFSLVAKNILDTKNILYKMFKDLTETAEKPFRDKVLQLDSVIKSFADQCASELGLPNSENPINLPQRIARLLERASIQHDFYTYSKFSAGKRGVVDKIAFSDLTGANVHARSGDTHEGIAVTDIYFDIRETISELKSLDKLWVTWFNVIDDESDPEKIQIKVEVFKEHYIIHFLYNYKTKEGEELVLSNFKHYEGVLD